MKLALTIVVAVAVALLVAIRVPQTAELLEDVPGISWLVELIGAADEHASPVELRFRADHPEQLASIHLPNATVRGDLLLITAHDDLDATVEREHLAAGRPGPFSAYVVVYQSDELTAISRALHGDDQAQKLGISVELDHVGYHIHTKDGGMYVNPDWAEQHHCGTRDRIVGTGVYCYVTAAERLRAYMQGDPGLFTDPHTFPFPGDRTFLPDDDDTSERFYEVELPMFPVDLTAVSVDGDALDATLAAPLPERATAPDAEVMIKIGRKLYVATRTPGGLRIATGAVLADELATSYALAAAGLHELR